MKTEVAHALMRPNMVVGIGAPVVISTLTCLACRRSMPLFSGAAFALLVFNNVNLVICLCEIILGLRIEFIKADYKKMKQKIGDGSKGYTEYTACFEFLFDQAAPTWLSLFTTAHPWARMWSVYALLDPSYQNDDTFGFFVDVGNGVSTIPACVLWNAALAGILPAWMTTPQAQVILAVLGIASYWQMTYGTLVYWFSYFYHKRYRIRNPSRAVGIVSAANGVWVLFPAIGMLFAVRILRELANGNKNAMDAVFCGIGR